MIALCAPHIFFVLNFFSSYTHLAVACVNIPDAMCKCNSQVAATLIISATKVLHHEIINRSIRELTIGFD